MHFIQKYIIDELRKAPELRYTKMRPEGVESGHFRYHVQQLITEGLIEQPERGLYRLSLSGKQYVDTLSEGRIAPHKMPKVITYTLLKLDDSLLLHRKKKEPYRGLLNMVGGKVHQGETTLEASSREVNEVTSQRISGQKLISIQEVQIIHQEALLSHVIAYVYVSHVEDLFRDSLVRVSHAQLEAQGELAPDLLPILGAITDDSSPALGSVHVTF